MNLFDYAPWTNFQALNGLGSPHSVTIAKTFSAESELISAADFARKTDQSLLILLDEKVQHLFSLNEHRTNGREWQDRHICAVNSMNIVETIIADSVHSSSHETLVFVGELLNLSKDPRQLLCALRIAAQKNKNLNFCFTQPDKSTTEFSSEYRRFWDQETFADFLGAFGFVQDLSYGPRGIPRATRRERIRSQIWRYSESNFQKQLEKVGLNSRVELLLLASEHAGIVGRTGGIGNYIIELEALFPETALSLLACDVQYFSKDYLEKKTDNTPLFVGDVCSRASDIFEQCQLAVEHIATLLDSLKLVEIQDYTGIGFRVAQSRRAGTLRPGVKVYTRMHGIQRYVDFASNFRSEPRDLGVDLRERTQIELSDSAVFPSEFLRSLCSNDLNLDSPEPQLLRLPHTGAAALVEEAKDRLREVSTLVFFGKPSAMKGFDLFCDSLTAISGLTDSRLKPRELDVVFVGVSAHEPSFDKSKFRSVKFSGDLTRDQVETQLLKLRTSSVFVLPYRGDNAPISVDLVALLGCRLICLDAGGVPELLSPEVHDHCLAEPNSKALSEQIIQAIRETSEKRNLIAQETQRWALDAKRQANSDNREFYASIPRIVPTGASSTNPSDVTAVISNYEGNQEHIADALSSLENSYLPPQRVIVADDGSSVEHLSMLRGLSEKVFVYIPCEIKSLDKNSGLSAVRNYAVSEIATKYALFLDNDDVLTDDFIYRAKSILDADPDVSAVVAHSLYFPDGSNWRNLEEQGDGFQPVSQDLAIGFGRNIFGHATAMFRTETLIELGGWDESSRAMWEDWEFYLRMTLQGKRILLLPKPNLLYRVSPSSMSRTYSKSEGVSRLRNAVPVRKKYQDMLLLALSQATKSSDELGNQTRTLFKSSAESKLQPLQPETIDALVRENAHLQLVLQEIQASRSWRFTRPIRELRFLLRGKM